MKNILSLLLIFLFYQTQQSFAQVTRSVSQPKDVFGMLQQQKAGKQGIKQGGIGNNSTKLQQLKSDLIQIQKLKDACPLLMKEKSSLELKGERADNILVNLDWKRKNGYDDRVYFLERSIGDTNHFETVAVVWAETRFKTNEKYSRDDQNDYTGTSYYRLRLKLGAENNQTMVLERNQQILSNIVAVKGFGPEKLSVWPNPASVNTSVRMETLIKGPATLQILDLQGRVIKQEKLVLYEGVNIRNMNTGHLPQGTYIIKVTKMDKSLLKGKLVKN